MLLNHKQSCKSSLLVNQRWLFRSQHRLLQIWWNSSSQYRHELLQRLSILRCCCHPQQQAIQQELLPLLLPQALLLHPS